MQSQSSANKPGQNSSAATRFFSLLAPLLALSGLLISHQVQAAGLPETNKTAINADEIVNKINAVNDGEHVTRNLTMTMTDKRGKVRVRETLAYRKYYGDEKRTILFYKKPTNVKGTSFLTYDYPVANKDDDQWLYLPALRKVRRISASDRGDYFLGTDFTYEDIKLEGKLDVEDLNFATVKTEKLTTPDNQTLDTVVIRATAKTNEIAKELGYSHSQFWVDQANSVIVKQQFWDTKGKLLKTLVVSDISEVDGIITRHKMDIENHKTGHFTNFVFHQVDYKAPVKDSLFSKRAMKQGK